MFEVRGTPIPMKLKNASKKIALGTVNIDVTTIAPNVLGKICLNINLNFEAPNVFMRSDDSFLIFEF